MKEALGIIYMFNLRCGKWLRSFPWKRRRARGIGFGSWLVQECCNRISWCFGETSQPWRVENEHFGNEKNETSLENERNYEIVGNWLQVKIRVTIKKWVIYSIRKLKKIKLEQEKGEFDNQ